VKGVVNASLQFDAERIAPTYSFVKGIPGRSYGISIARKLRLQESVVARAEERVPSTERDLAALVEKLERQQSELSARDAELSVLLEDAKKRSQELSRRERNVREREREVERQSRQEARKYLLNARAEIDRTVRDLKKAGASELEEKARDARKLAEQLAAKQADVIEQLDAEAAKREKVPRGTAVVTAVPGDVVIVESMGGKTGRLIELRDADALVAVGSMKLTVPARTLTRVEPDKIEKAVAWHGDLPEEQVRSEIDLRGMRPDEMESVLLQALDDAIRADLPTLTIIHGKGTGALRERAAEMLRKDTRVRQFRAGAWNEGGTGVTIAELR
jgi:DNA mismatch repair protein MutS2